MSRSESDVEGEFFDALVGNENESSSDTAPSPRNIPSPILSVDSSEDSEESRKDPVFSDISADGFSDGEAGSDNHSDSTHGEMIEVDRSLSPQSSEHNHFNDLAKFEYLSEEELSEKLSGFQKIGVNPNKQTEVKPTGGLSSIIKRFFCLSAEPLIKDGNIRVKSHMKEGTDFTGLTLTQTLKKSGHCGRSIWTMKFSHDGAFLATGDSDGMICIWSVGLHPSDSLESKDHRSFLNERLRKLSIPDDPNKRSSSREGTKNSSKFCLFSPEPYKTLSGHTKDVVDLSWSRQETKILISASVDRTVRLWFITSGNHLKFLHPDIVSCVDFYPLLDLPLLFVSGCMDQKIRIWTLIPKGSCLEDSEVLEKDSVNAPEMVTSIAFHPDGKMIAAGLFKGQVIFFAFNSSGLRFFTQMDCRNKLGKFRNGRNVTGISFFKNYAVNNGSEEMLVSMNDSRIRLCDLQDFSVFSKMKGAQNESMQIKATFSEDGKYVISGSETGGVYIWNRHPVGLAAEKRLKGDKVLRNRSYETFTASTGLGSATIVAIFAPASAVTKATQINNGVYILDFMQDLCSRIIVTADHHGDINVFSRGLDA